MSQSDSSVSAAFAAAQGLIRVALLGTVPDVANNLLLRMKGAPTYHERSQLAYAQLHILENRDLFLTAFAGLLTQGVEVEIGRAGAARAASEDPTGSRSAWSTRDRSRRRSPSSGSAS